MRIARVLCILALVYVHAPPYGDALPHALLSSEGVLWSWREIVGRTSVALLSVVSGFLVVRLEGGGGWAANMRRKVTTLIVPLLLWNGLTVLKNIAESGGHAIPGPAQLPRLLLALDGFPATVPTYFLRDLFVCNLLLVPLLLLARRAPRITFLLLLANAFLGVEGPLFLNDVIPLFYFAGLVLGVGSLRWLNSVDLGDARKAVPVALCALAVLLGETLARFWAGPAAATELHQAGIILGRFAGAILFWLIAMRLRPTAAAGRIQAFEPIIFFVFCSHPLALGLAWWCLSTLDVAFGSPAYITFFLFSPLISLFAGLIGVAVMRRLAPWLLAPLMGGRIPSDKQMAGIARVLMPWRRPPEPPVDTKARDMAGEKV